MGMLGFLAGEAEAEAAGAAVAGVAGLVAAGAEGAGGASGEGAGPQAASSAGAAASIRRRRRDPESAVVMEREGNAARGRQARGLAQAPWAAAAGGVFHRFLVENEAGQPWPVRSRMVRTQ